MFRGEPGSGKEEFAMEIDRLKAGRKSRHSNRVRLRRDHGTARQDTGQTTMEWIDSYVAAGFHSGRAAEGDDHDTSELLGIEARVGAIKAGMIADIIAMPASPLDNPQASSRSTS
jgi:hypothetical protein